MMHGIMNLKFTDTCIYGLHYTIIQKYNKQVGNKDWWVA